MSGDSLRPFLQRDTQPLLCSMGWLPRCPLRERNEVTSQAKFQKAMKFLLVSAGTFAGSLRPPYRNSVTLTLPYGKTMWRDSQERKSSGTPVPRAQLLESECRNLPEYGSPNHFLTCNLMPDHGKMIWPRPANSSFTSKIIRLFFFFCKPLF